MTTKERDAARQQRRVRRPATTRQWHNENNAKRKEVCRSNRPWTILRKQCCQWITINHSSQEMSQIDHPDVIQRILRILSDLQNVLCNICKERRSTKISLWWILAKTFWTLVSVVPWSIVLHVFIYSIISLCVSISYFVSFLRLAPTCFSICLVLSGICM